MNFKNQILLDILIGEVNHSVPGRLIELSVNSRPVGRLSWLELQMYYLKDTYLVL